MVHHVPSHADPRAPRAGPRAEALAGAAGPPQRLSSALSAYAATLYSADGRRALIETAKAIPPDDADALAEKYARIALPTLILWGRHDAIIPLPIGERLHRAIGTSQLVVIDDAGHLPHEETPDLVCEALGRFLG